MYDGRHAFVGFIVRKLLFYDDDQSRSSEHKEEEETNYYGLKTNYGGDMQCNGDGRAEDK
jgi:hypothetical protein